MTTSAAEPAGYCPHCDYPMNGGKCHECGRTTASEHIHEESRPVRRKKVRRWVLIALAIQALIVVGIVLHHYRFVDWSRWMPDSILARMREYEGDRWENEIVRRLKNDNLSDSAKQDYLIDKVLPFGFVPIKTCPAGAPILLRIEERPFGSSEMRFNGFTDWELIVDGEVVADSIAVDSAQLPRHRDCHFEFWCPQLTPGSHTVRLKGNARVCIGGSPGFSAPDVVTDVKHTLETTIEVEGPWLERVRVVSDDEMMSAVAGDFRAVAMTGEELGSQILVNIEAGKSCPPMAGVVLVRPSGGVGFGLLGRADFVNKRGAEFDITDIPGMEEATHIDVRVNPDPGYAMSCGADEVFGGFVEWTAVPIHRDLTWRDLRTRWADIAQLGRVEAPGALPLD